MRINRTLSQKCLAIFLTAMIALSPLAMTGCGASELVADITTAQAVASSAGNILSASNPQAGALLVTAASDLGELASLVNQYDASVAAGKPGIATQIQAITGTLTANLTTILATVKVSNPELVEYITVAVAVANSTITIILAHLPAAGVTAQAAVVSQSGALPTVPFKTHKDLKAAWNNAISKNYPKAKI